MESTLRQYPAPTFCRATGLPLSAPYDAGTALHFRLSGAMPPGKCSPLTGSGRKGG